MFKREIEEKLNKIDNDLWRRLRDWAKRRERERERKKKLNLF